MRELRVFTWPLDTVKSSWICWLAPIRPAGPNRPLLFERWMDTRKWILQRTGRFA